MLTKIILAMFSISSVRARITRAADFPGRTGPFCPFHRAGRPLDGPPAQFLAPANDKARFFPKSKQRLARKGINPNANGERRSRTARKRPDDVNAPQLQGGGRRTVGWPPLAIKAGSKYGRSRPGGN